MTTIEIAREYFPEAPDSVLDYIVWNYTGYPHFWNIPHDGKTPEDCFRKHLQNAKDAIGDEWKRTLPGWRLSE